MKKDIWDRERNDFKMSFFHFGHFFSLFYDHFFYLRPLLLAAREQGPGRQVTYRITRASHKP
jgi:glucan biosynthesis protein